MADIIQLKRGTAAAWTAANPILAEAEEGYETDSRKKKIGDGVTAWNSLPYFGTGILEVVEDITPQLGGDLDVQGNNISNVGDLVLSTDGGIIKKSAIGVLAARNVADSAYARLKVATPTEADDAVTVTYLGGTDKRPLTFNININTSGVVDCALGQRLKSNPTTTADREITSVTNLTRDTVLDFTASSHTVKFSSGVKADASNKIYGDDTITGPMIVVTPKDGGGFIAVYANAKREDSLVIPCSASKSDLAVLTGAFAMPVFEAFTINEISAGVTTAPTGASIIADIKKNGTTILSTLITIEAGETTTLTATNQPVISSGSFTEGDVLSIDITQVGSTVAGQELKVRLKISYD